MPSRRTPWCRDGPNPPQCPRYKSSRRQVWRRELARLLERKYSIIFLQKFISKPFSPPSFSCCILLVELERGRLYLMTILSADTRLDLTSVQWVTLLSWRWLWWSDSDPLIYMGVYSAESLRGWGRHYKVFFSGILGRIRNFGWYFCLF